MAGVTIGQATSLNPTIATQLPASMPGDTTAYRVTAAGVAALADEVGLTAATLVGATSVVVSRLPTGAVANSGWIVIDPYTVECEIRKVTGITGTTCTVAALAYAHALGDGVIWVDQPEAVVNWFGGTTRDAISYAVTQINGLGGGVVRFTPGTYTISGSVITLSGMANITFLADRGAVLTHNSNDFRVFNVTNCSNMQFDGLRVTGNFDAATQNYSSGGFIVTDNAPSAGSTSKLLVKNCVFTNLNGDCVRIGPNTSDVIIANNVMSGGLGFVEVVGVENGGDLRPVKRVLIDGNQIVGTLTTPRAVGINGSDDLIDVGGAVRGLTITNNQFDLGASRTTTTTYSTAILCYTTVDYGTTEDVIISKNICKNFDNDGNTDSTVIDVYCSNVNYAVNRVLISENIIENCYKGIRAYYGGTSITIANNVIANSYRGIIVELTDDSIVSGNNIIGAENIGMFLQSNRTLVHGNRFLDCTTAGCTCVWSTTGNDKQFIGNMIQNGVADGYGFRLLAGDRCQLLGNAVSNHPGSAVNVGAGVSTTKVYDTAYYNNGTNLTDNGTGTVTR